MSGADDEESAASELTPRLGKAFFDLDHGMDLGLHRRLQSHKVSKLLYSLGACLLWLLLGSFVFWYLEDGGWERYEHEDTYNFDTMIATLRQFSNETQVTLNDAQRAELLHAANWMERHQPAPVEWGLAGGFFFSVLSITTIGYGRYLCPHTIMGRLFVIPYTLAGIPLVGIFYTVWASYSLEKIKKYVTRYSTMSTNSNKRALMVSFVFLIFLLCGLGPLLFMVMEDWGYYEAVYFVYVSVSTIGYGDFVPHTTVGKVVGVILIPFGLGVTALVFTSISELFEDAYLYLDYNAETALSDEDKKGRHLGDMPSSPGTIETLKIKRGLQERIAEGGDRELEKGEEEPKDTTPLLGSTKAAQQAEEAAAPEDTA